MTIGETAVIQNLEQEIKDLWMRLFNLIKQDYTIRTPVYRFGQLASLIVAEADGLAASSVSPRSASDLTCPRSTVSVPV